MEYLDMRDIIFMCFFYLNKLLDNVFDIIVSFPLFFIPFFILVLVVSIFALFRWVL